MNDTMQLNIQKRCQILISVLIVLFVFIYLAMLVFLSLLGLQTPSSSSAVAQPRSLYVEQSVLTLQNSPCHGVAPGQMGSWQPLYIVVIMAALASTSVHSFAFLRCCLDNKFILQKEDYWSVDDSIANYATRSGRLYSLYDPLLKKAEKFVPKRFRKFTPLLFRGSCAFEDVLPKGALQFLLRRTRLILRKYSFLLKHKVSIMKDGEEAADIWLSGSFLSGHIYTNSSPPLAVVDLSGGIFQIAYPIFAKSTSPLTPSIPSTLSPVKDSSIFSPFLLMSSSIHPGLSLSPKVNKKFRTPNDPSAEVRWKRTKRGNEDTLGLRRSFRSRRNSLKDKQSLIGKERKLIFHRGDPIAGDKFSKHIYQNSSIEKYMNEPIFSKPLNKPLTHNETETHKFILGNSKGALNEDATLKKIQQRKRGVGSQSSQNHSFIWKSRTRSMRPNLSLFNEQIQNKSQKLTIEVKPDILVNQKLSDIRKPQENKSKIQFSYQNFYRPLHKTQMKNSFRSKEKIHSDITIPVNPSFHNEHKYLPNKNNITTPPFYSERLHAKNKTLGKIYFKPLKETDRLSKNNEASLSTPSARLIQAPDQSPVLAFEGKAAFKRHKYVGSKIDYIVRPKTSYQESGNYALSLNFQKNGKRNSPMKNKIKLTTPLRHPINRERNMHRKIVKRKFLEIDFSFDKQRMKPNRKANLKSYERRKRFSESLFHTYLLLYQNTKKVISPHQMIDYREVPYFKHFIGNALATRLADFNRKPKWPKFPLHATLNVTRFPINYANSLQQILKKNNHATKATYFKRKREKRRTRDSLNDMFHATPNSSKFKDMVRLTDLLNLQNTSKRYDKKVRLKYKKIENYTFENAEETVDANAAHSQLDVHESISTLKPDRPPFGKSTDATEGLSPLNRFPAYEIHRKGRKMRRNERRRKDNRKTSRNITVRCTPSKKFWLFAISFPIGIYPARVAVLLGKNISLLSPSQMLGKGAMKFVTPNHRSRSDIPPVEKYKKEWKNSLSTKFIPIQSTTLPTPEPKGPGPPRSSPMPHLNATSQPFADASPLWTQDTLNKVTNVVDSILRAIGSHRSEPTKIVENGLKKDKKTNKGKLFQLKGLHRRASALSATKKSNKIKIPSKAYKRRTRKRMRKALNVNLHRNSLYSKENVSLHLNESQIAGKLELNEGKTKTSPPFISSSGIEFRTKNGAISSLRDLVFSGPNVTVTNPNMNDAASGEIKNTEKLVRTSFAEVLQHKVPLREITSNNSAMEDNYDASEKPDNDLSFPFLGLNKIKKTLAKPIDDLVISSPCIPVNSRGHFTLDGVRYEITEANVENKFDSCWEKVKKVVEKYINVPSMKGMDLIANRAFYYVAARANFIDESNTIGYVKASKFKLAAEEICGKPSHLSPDPLACLDYQFIAALLLHGLKIPPETEIMVTDNTGEFRLSSALGAALNYLQRF